MDDTCCCYVLLVMNRTGIPEVDASPSTLGPADAVQDDPDAAAEIDVAAAAVAADDDDEWAPLNWSTDRQTSAAPTAAAVDCEEKIVATSHLKQNSNYKRLQTNGCKVCNLVNHLVIWM